MKAVYCALVAAGLLCLSAAGQEKSADKKKKAGAAPAAAQAPRPGPEMQDLRSFVGTWTSEDTYEPSPMAPNGGTGSGTSIYRMGPGGFSLLMDIRSKSPMGNFTGHGMIAWDAAAKAYKFVWADSFTPGLLMENGHKQGETLVFTGEMMMSGKKMATKDVISDRTPTSYTLTSYLNDGSGEKKVMTSKATKQETAPKK